MNLVLIAAIGKNNELGKDNKLIWYLPNDLKFFKEKTTNHPIVMGYNTFKSFPKLLPNRKHIVLTHHDEIEFPEEVLVFHDKEKLLEHLSQIDDEVFIIGGASIYKQFLDDANRMLLTHIDKEEKEADAYFPKFQEKDWEISEIKANEDNGIKYKHLEYRRKYER